MNRLTQCLLASTIVPGLALTALSPVSAQAPDPRERHGQGQGQRPEGGDRAAHGPGGGQQNQGRQREPGGNAGNAERRQVGNPRQDAQQGGTPRIQGAPVRANEAPRNHPPLPGDTQRAAKPDRAQPAERAQNRDDHDQNKLKRGDRTAPGDNAQRDNTKRDNGQRSEPSVPRRADDGDRRGPGRPDKAQRDGDPGTSGRIDPRDTARPDNAIRNQDPRNPNQRAGNPGEPRRIGNGDNIGQAPRNLPPGNLPPRDERRPGPAGIAIGVGVGAGVAAVVGGGFLPPTNARRLDDLRRDRREIRTGDSTFIREPGRTIIEQNGRAFVVHDENDRFRALGFDVRRERRGNTFVDTINRPDGVQILTFTDISGRLLRRVRRTRDGREFVLIDNGDGGHIQRYQDDVVVLPPPPLRLPRDRYVVDYRDANEGLLYDTLIAPPLAAPPRRYTLDQIRYSPDIRNYVRSVDINTINFDTGSWDVPAAATGQLQALASAIKRAIGRDPNSVFLIEGFTDATGNADDNLSLSDRRAQSVAEILTKDFGVPPENLTSQGYGQQNLRENTPGPSAVNRRVVVQNITQLLASGDQPGSEQ